MANKEQKGNANNKKVAKLSLKEKRLKKQEKKKHQLCLYATELFFIRCLGNVTTDCYQR